MNSTTTNEPTPFSGMLLSQMMIIGIIFGFTLKTSLIGSIGTGIRLIKEYKNFWKVAAIICSFNFWCITFTSLFAINFFHHEPQYCVPTSFWLNFSSHVFFFHFDFFLLYKTVAISQWNKTVCIFSAALLVHRIGWAIADLAESKGVWNDATGCEYSQDPLTGLGYNGADLICDAFATITCILFNYHMMTQKWATLVRTLVQENILRSLVIVTMNSIMLYSSAHITDAFLMNLCYACQNYVYCVAVNSELYWSEKRKNIIRNKSNESREPEELITLPQGQTTRKESVKK